MTGNPRDDAPKRRTFLSALPALAVAPAMAAATGEKLAIEGGTAVCSTRLTTEYPGAQFYRMIEMTCAVLLAQLRKAETILACHRRNAATLRKDKAATLASLRRPT